MQMEDHPQGMMKTTFSLLLLFVSSLHGANNLDIYFDIENKNQSLSIVELKAAAEAKKIIRDNAYLGLSNKFNPEESLCWLNFIKNRKIKIYTSGNAHLMISKNKYLYKYKITLEPSKIKVHDVTANDFLSFCETSEISKIKFKN
jgi:hypothetical protein